MSDNLNMESKEESEFSPIAKQPIKELKNYWVCVSPNGWPEYDTISSLKRDSITKLMAVGYKDWEKRKKEGWRCVKVHVTFKEL